MACFYAGVIYAVYLFYCGAKARRRPPYSPHSLPPLLFAFEPLLPMTPRPALAATGDVMVGEKG